LYRPEAEIKPHIRDHLYYITATFHGIIGAQRPWKPTICKWQYSNFFPSLFPCDAHKTSR